MSQGGEVTEVMGLVDPKTGVSWDGFSSSKKTKTMDIHNGERIP